MYWNLWNSIDYSSERGGATFWKCQTRCCCRYRVIRWWRSRQLVIQATSFLSCSIPVHLYHVSRLICVHFVVVQVCCMLLLPYDADLHDGAEYYSILSSGLSINVLNQNDSLDGVKTVWERKPHRKSLKKHIKFIGLSFTCKGEDIHKSYWFLDDSPDDVLKTVAKDAYDPFMYNPRSLVIVSYQKRCGNSRR